MIGYRHDNWMAGDRSDCWGWFSSCLDVGTIVVVAVIDKSFMRSSRSLVWFVSCHGRVDTLLNEVEFG